MFISNLKEESIIIRRVNGTELSLPYYIQLCNWVDENDTDLSRYVQYNTIQNKTIQYNIKLDRRKYKTV